MEFKLNLKSNENRPSSLNVMCILSWINIGFSFVITVVRLLSGPLTDIQIAESKVEWKSAVVELRNENFSLLADTVEKSSNMLVVLNQHHYFIMSITLLGLLLGFLGVSMMFLGRRLGFHLYIVYSIYSIFQIYFFFPVAEIPSLITWIQLGIAALFVLLYARDLKWMK